MDGFKNSTKTSYDTTSGKKFAGGGMMVSRNDTVGGEAPMNKPAMVAKYAKGGHVKKAEQKIGRVMEEFTKGKLHSGSKEGPKVKSTKQAVAIALNEARAAGAKIPRVKKNLGGAITEAEYNAMKSAEADDALMARMTPKELAMGLKGIRMARERLGKRESGKASPEMVVRKYESVVAEPIGKNLRARFGATITEQERRAMEAIKPARKGVPAAGREPIISDRMREVGRSLGMNKGGVTKKAMGGLTLSNVPQSARLTLSNVPKTAPAAAPAAAPKRGLTLASTTPPKRGLRLGMNKGGLSVMPKGKGC